MSPPQELLDNRSDPDARAVLEDFELTHGWRPTRIGVFLHDAADDDADDAAADDVGDDDDADDDDADDADLTRSRNRHAMFSGEQDMENGLKLVVLPGRYGYNAVFVAWFKRVGGDEWQMLPGYRAVWCTGTRRGLAWLAANGPGKDYKLREPSEVAEPVHRLVARRVLNADVKAWAKECPQPKPWES